MEEKRSCVRKRQTMPKILKVGEMQFSLLWKNNNKQIENGVM